MFLLKCEIFKEEKQKSTYDIDKINHLIFQENMYQPRKGKIVIMKHTEFPHLV